MVSTIHRLFETCRYGLVDANARSEIPEHWAQQVVAPAFLETDTSRSPLLVCTDTLADADVGKLLDRIESETEGNFPGLFSLFLACDAELPRVASHLASRLVVKLEHNGRPMQFRYFDPGTFVQLPELLGEAGMNWLLGPINAVMVPWAGEFRRYEKPLTSHQKFSLQPYLPVLLDISIVNRAAMRLDPPADQQDWIERCARIRKHVQRAREKHQLSIRDDIIAFALHAENCHPRFDDHEILRSLFAQLSTAKEEDQIDYRELTIGLGQEVWNKIARDLAKNESLEGISS